MVGESTVPTLQPTSPTGTIVGKGAGICRLTGFPVAVAEISVGSKNPRWEVSVQIRPGRNFTDVEAGMLEIGAGLSLVKLTSSQKLWHVRARVEYSLKILP